MISRPSPQHASALLEALRVGLADRLFFIDQALSAGAPANRADVLKAWQEQPSHWSDKPALGLLEAAGLDVAALLCAATPDARHPLHRAVTGPHRCQTKTQLLLERAADPSPALEAWMGEERVLDEWELKLFEAALGRNGRVSEEAIDKALAISEDTERLLLLVKAGQLDPNRTVEVGMPMGLCQSIALYGRHGSLQEWVDAGGNLDPPLPNGRTVVTQLLTETTGKVAGFRLTRLKELVELGVNWHHPDALGETPWEHLCRRTVEASSEGWWESVRAQAREQHLAAALAPAGTSALRRRL